MSHPRPGRPLARADPPAGTSSPPKKGWSTEAYPPLRHTRQGARPYCKSWTPKAVAGQGQKGYAFLTPGSPGTGPGQPACGASGPAPGLRPPAGARVAAHESVPRDPTSSRRPPRSPAKDGRRGGARSTAALGRRLRSAGRIRGREPAQGPPAPARAGPPPALPTFPPASQPPRPRSPRPTNLIAEMTSGGPGCPHSQSRHSGRRRRPMGAARGRDFPRPSLIEAGGGAG